MVGIGAISKIQVRIGADIRPLTSALGTAKTQVAGFGRGITRALPGASFLALGVAGAFAGIGIAALRASAQVEKGLAEVSTLLEGSADAAEIFGDEVSRLSIELAASGGELEVAKGLYQAISAGITDAAEATEFLEVSMRAAVAGVSNTFTAVDVLTSVVNAYGLEAEEAERISDILFTTVKRGKTTFSELGSSIGRLVAISAQVGVSFEEVSAAIATLTKQGQSTDDAVTALRSTMKSFLIPQEELQDVINRVAVAQGFASDEFLVAMDALMNAERAVVSTNSEYDNQVRVLGDLQGVYDVLNDSLKETAGEMDDLGDTMAVNRLEIREIRLTARNEGRKLTEQEIRDIAAIELANENLGVSHDKLSIKQDNAKETTDELNEGLQAQKDAVKGTQDQIKASEKNVEDLTENLGELDAASGATILEMFGLQEGLKLITDEAGTDAATIGKLFGNIRTLQAVLPLAGGAAETFTEDLEAMNNATGATDVAFEIMADNVDFKWTKSMNKAKVVTRELGDTMQDSLLPVIENGITPAIKEMSGVLGDAITGVRLLNEATKGLRAAPREGRLPTLLGVGPGISLPGGQIFREGGEPASDSGGSTTQNNDITVNNEISGTNLSADEISRATEEGVIRAVRSISQ